MKKKILTIMMALFGITTITYMGCSPLTSGQIKAIAQQAGLFGAVGWIAIDNPSTEVKNTIKSIVTLISDNAVKLENDQTYTEVLYPIIVDYVITNVDLQYQPISKAGSIAILGALDMLFAANPEWADEEDIVIDVIKMFCIGADSGLGMSAEDPIMRSALRSAALRGTLKLNN